MCALRHSGAEYAEENTTECEGDGSRGRMVNRPGAAAEEGEAGCGQGCPSPRQHGAFGLQAGVAVGCCRHRATTHVQAITMMHTPVTVTRMIIGDGNGLSRLIAA